MRWALVACALLAGACQPAENIPEEAEAPPVPVTAPELTSTTVVLAPTTTEPPATTTTTEVVVEVSTTLPAPILCPSLPHPAHHRECPMTTSTAVLRQQTPIQPEASSSTALPYNGWAIPEYIVSCETGGTFNWYAYNASGASGPYQLMPMHFGGELAMYQSRAAQHAKAAELWNGGKGRHHWQECL